MEFILKGLSSHQYNKLYYYKTTPRLRTLKILLYLSHNPPTVPTLDSPFVKSPSINTNHHLHVPHSAHLTSPHLLSLIHSLTHFVKRLTIHSLFPFSCSVCITRRNRGAPTCQQGALETHWSA